MAELQSTRVSVAGRFRRDLTGQRFGMLTVVRLGESSKRGRLTWECICDCGRATTVITSSINNGSTRSCGCLRRHPNAKTHGASSTAEYRVWSHVIDRCENPSSKDYADYGGRGITMCQEWRESFAAFLNDMGVRPSPTHSIERVDVNGNYCPGNCKWATASEQARNKRNFRRLTHNGETLTLAGWSERTGIPIATIKWRFTHGRTAEQVLHIAT